MFLLARGRLEQSLGTRVPRPALQAAQKARPRVNAGRVSSLVKTVYEHMCLYTCIFPALILLLKPFGFIFLRKMCF